MRRMTAIVLLVITAVTLGGCASINKAMGAWIGKSSHELILQWGPPASETTDGAGGSVLTWQYWVPQTSVFVPRVGYITVGGYMATRSFYVRPDGTIYSYRWQGL